jgi:hypothetical protein
MRVATDEPPRLSPEELAELEAGIAEADRGELISGEEFFRQLPEEPQERLAVLDPGLREWRIRRALENYRQGVGSLAFAAHQAGISLREMIPLAYAHGLEPESEPADLGATLSTQIDW